MAEAIIVSRRFTFGLPEKQADGTETFRNIITIPIGVFADQKAADDAARDAGSVHSLANGAIVINGKPVMSLLQWAMAMGISSFGIVFEKARVREASLLIVPPGAVKLNS